MRGGRGEVMRSPSEAMAFSIDFCGYSHSHEHFKSVLHTGASGALAELADKAHAACILIVLGIKKACNNKNSVDVCTVPKRSISFVSQRLPFAGGTAECALQLTSILFPIPIPAGTRRTPLVALRSPEKTETPPPTLTPAPPML